MAHPWQYPRWRRVLMQAAMWVLLALVIALAATVNHGRYDTSAVMLGQSVTRDGMSVRLPRKWTVHDMRGAVLAEEDPDDNKWYARRLRIWREDINGFVPPKQVLLSYRQVAERVQQQMESGVDPFEQVTIGTWPGVMVNLDPPAMLRVQGGMPKLLAAAVLPSRQVVMVQLNGYGRVTPADRLLMVDVAGSIAFDGLTYDAQAGGEVALHGGISVMTPPGFTHLPEPDPNRLSRLLLHAEAESWMSAELIPCLVTDDRPDALLSLLVIQDGRWLGGQITQLGPRQWRIDFPTTQDAQEDHASQNATPTRAHVLAAENGQGLLVIFHATGDRQEAIDQAWAALAESAKFDEFVNINQLAQAGAEQIRRFKAQGLAQLLSEPREEQWWLWYRQSPPHYVGWSHLRFSPNGELAVQHEMRWVGAIGRHVVRVVQQWHSSDDMEQYRCVTARYESPDGATPFSQVLRQTVAVQDGTMQSVYERQGVPVGVQSRPVTEAYVPGSWLPLLIGQITDGPVIVQTDSFMRLEGMVPPGLLTLVIEPADRPPPGAADALEVGVDGEALRCVTVQVNGSGQVSRWYYEANDDEVRMVDFVGGLRRVPATSNDLLQGFEDPRMQPAPGQ